MGRYALGALVLALAMLSVIAYCTLRASLPQLEGLATVPDKALRAHATIERDAEGMPTIKAASRADLAYATGFAHAQDRFFQMDLMRRAASGELAELFGPAMLDTDKGFRIHDFRGVAAQVLSDAQPADRAILDAYVAGVNAGLGALGARPWEYFLLRSVPRPWTAADSMLVAFSMYLNLNDSTGETERARAALRDGLPAEVFAFLHPYGTSWDAPLTGNAWRGPPIPSADIFDLRRAAMRRTAGGAEPHSPTSSFAEADIVGSNSWAVAGSHTASGAALLANDMHLPMRLPNVWYRARLMVTGSANSSLDLVGVTLPGLPMLIVGSNGHVAWGYTNSYGDWSDVVLVEADPANRERYRFADGVEPFRVRHETIQVRGAAAVPLAVRVTRWGPVIGKDTAGRSLVLAWTAHHARASNLELLRLEQARDLDAALDTANLAGGPVQNFVAADASGRIGWSLLGQVPVRANYDSSMPASWQPDGTGWIGWRAPQEYPRIVDPANGRLWTANARTLDAPTWLNFAGEGGYDLGARANQIRDDLLALERATVDDMRRIQLDDRALFLTRWRDLLLGLLTLEATRDHPARAAARSLVEKWSARAAPDDPGYRIVRAFRLKVRDAVYGSLIDVVKRKSPRLKFVPSPQFEAPLWQIVTEQPAHLLSPVHASWNEALLGYLDQSLADLPPQCESLSNCSWGRQNTLAMRHPLSSAMPLLGRWLDMPPQALPGDVAMPRVQGTAFGASERLIVSPGREAEGLLQLPGGPVDHPLSPFYGAGHAAWASGEAHPLLPGKTKYALRLEPRS